MFLSPTDSSEIENIINNLNNNKASDIYNMPAKLLKIGIKYTSKQLTHIFNHSFLTGTFPDKLKLAYVVPIHKADSKLSVGK